MNPKSSVLEPSTHSKTQRAMQLTETVTTRWTSRIAGSEACLAAADYLKTYFGEFCDRAYTHSFKVRPGGFLGYFKINVIFYFLALLSFWGQFFWLAGVLGTIPVVATIFEFFFYKEFVDPLFPEKEGKNVLGVIEPSGTVKQQIIVSGHHDSAHIFNFLVDKPELYPVKSIWGTISMFGIALVSWIFFGLQLFEIHSNIALYATAGVFSLLSYWVIQFWTFFEKEGTPGAGDNMICSAIAAEVGRYFVNQRSAGQGLKHTRIIVASFDAEEAGLRGARRFVRDHKKDLLATKTYNFNLECMYDHEEMGFLTTDQNSFVKLSEAMVDECLEASTALGYTVKKTPLPMFAGGTDAAEFAKAGIEATCLAAMHWATKGSEPAYHTLRDTVDSIDILAVEKTINLVIRYIEDREEKVL
ncbi:MAG: M28 family peptidase [Bacteroidota bacterium]